MAGAAPSFSEVHVLRTLLMLRKKHGRKRLTDSLDLGEGSIRTILKKLKTHGLIESDEYGQKLSAKGKRYLKKYLDKFDAPEKFSSTDLDGKQVLCVVHDASKRVRSGVMERDTAIKSGANGALILTFNKKLKFPNKDVNLEDYEDLNSKLKGKKFRNGDVVVIGFADNYANAENGAVAIVLGLLG